jgi:hypothetical protein
VYFCLTSKCIFQLVRTMYELMLIHRLIFSQLVWIGESKLLRSHTVESLPDPKPQYLLPQEQQEHHHLGLTRLTRPHLVVSVLVELLDDLLLLVVIRSLKRNYIFYSSLWLLLCLFNFNWTYHLYLTWATLLFFYRLLWKKKRSEARPGDEHPIFVTQITAEVLKEHITSSTFFCI